MKTGVSVFPALVLLVMTSSLAQADAAAGQAAFESNGCQSCHYTQGPATEKTIADQLAKKGPELWYAGSKFQRPWLETWLVDPQPIRPMKFNSVMEPNPGGHAVLSADQAGPVADYLMSLRSDIVVDGAVKVKKKNLKGKLIFIKKMPCSGCHQFPTKKKFSGGLSGPSLIGAGKRLNPDWVLAYLREPKVFKPVKMMPVFVGVLSDKDMKNVAAHVATFK